MRALIGELPIDIKITRGRAPRSPGEAIVGINAASQLHLPDVVGTVVDQYGLYTAVVGEFEAAGPLALLNRAALVLPRSDGLDVMPRYIFSLAADATQVQDLIDPITAAVQAQNQSAITVEASSGAIELRSVLAGHLGASTRQLMALILAIGLALVIITTLGTVAGRRRDFGRRRALGASQSTIVAQILIQNAIAATTGVLIGIATGQLITRILVGSWVGLLYTASVGVLVILIALAGSVPPAIIAARRDPVRILRVP